MTARECGYLDQSRLRDAPTLLVFAADTIIDAALKCSASYRLEFDRAWLAAILDTATMAALLPGPPTRPDAPAGLEQQDHPLDEVRAHLLRQVMSFGSGQWAEPPLTAIERLVLFDRSGSVVLRASDSGDAILFALPGQARTELLARLHAGGVPAAAIQTVQVDINQNV